MTRKNKGDSMKRIFLSLMLLAFFAYPALAAIELQEGGVNKGIAHGLNFIGANVGEEGQGGIRDINVGGDIEAVTTDDTLTAAESGKVLVVTGARNQQIVITLPAAEADLEFAIVAGGEAQIIVKPDSADIIVFSISGAALSTGDRLATTGGQGSINGVTADSLILVTPDSTSWYVKSINGTWTDVD